MIEIKKLNKSFGDKTLFQDFNETIKNGEFIIFAGKSGCGKTTLLNMIGALEKPDGGHILVGGKDIHARKNQTEYFKNMVGFLFQNFALVENKTVRKNLELVQKKQRTEITVEEALQRVGLLEKAETPVYQLSGGEQQRIALARLMIKKCEIILADEPTGSLDSQNAGEVLKILKQMNRQGKTVILVTHDEKIINSGERVIHL